MNDSNISVDTVLEIPIHLVECSLVPEDILQCIFNRMYHSNLIFLFIVSIFQSGFPKKIHDTIRYGKYVKRTNLGIGSIIRHEYHSRYFDAHFLRSSHEYQIFHTRPVFINPSTIS